MDSGAREQAQIVEELLDEQYPEASCALNFSDAYQLLVATVLSAQTTDERVNTVTPDLFHEYPNAETLGQASVEDVEQIVYPLGMYRRRASQLVRLGQGLVEEFHGDVPGTRKELMRLPGVGRKTANVVLGNWFGAEEITVDTHVGRVSRRLGWTSATNPLKVEEDLRELLPDAPWTKLCHQLILHGRTVCHSRKPECDSCFLLGVCPQIF